MWRAFARWPSLALLLAGCGSPERAAPASDLELPPPRDDSIVDPEPPPPLLESPCGAVTVELEFVRPNLYFAIDASGSMSDDIPRAPPDPTAPLGPPLPSDRYGVLSMAIERLLQRIGHRVSYGATLFPTGDVTCDAGEEILELTPGDNVSFAVSGEPGPVLASFMSSIQRRVPRGGTPTAAALRALRSKLEGRGGESYLFLVTDGGPNCESTRFCGPEACIPNIERAQLGDSLRCEAPLNCCDGSWFGPESCLDAEGSRLAVEALAQAGIRTFVIGIPGSEVYAEVLDSLAENGGLARAGTPKYFRVEDAEQLIETVSDLGRQVALGCGIELAAPPPDPTLINVYFDGELVPADPENGWVFETETQLRLVGEACRLISTGEVLQANVVAGCPVIVR